MSDLRAAAKLLMSKASIANRYDNAGYLLAKAWLAEHPANDDLPVTEEWMTDSEVELVSWCAENVMGWVDSSGAWFIKYANPPLWSGWCATEQQYYESQWWRPLESWDHAMMVRDKMIADGWEFSQFSDEPGWTRFGGKESIHGSTKGIDQKALLLAALEAMEAKP